MKISRPQNKLSGSIKSQQGIVSIVFILLVSLALTTTSVGLIHSYKSSQQITIASNAVTHAQNGMWLGAEAFRRYLEGLHISDVTSLASQHNITLSDGRKIKVDNLTAVPDTATGTIQVTADLKHKHTVSRTSSAMRLVYDYQPPILPPSPLTRFKSVLMET